VTIRAHACEHRRPEDVLDVGLVAHPRVDRLARSHQEQGDQEPDRPAEDRVADRRRTCLACGARLVDDGRVRIEGLHQLERVELLAEVGCVRRRAPGAELAAQVGDRCPDRPAQHVRAPADVRVRHGVCRADGLRGLVARRSEGEDVVSAGGHARGVVELAGGAVGAVRLLRRSDVELRRARECLRGLLDTRRIDERRLRPRQRLGEVLVRDQDTRARLVARALQLPEGDERDGAEDDECDDEQRRPPEGSFEGFGSRSHLARR
jgi:hypothetical protein